MVSLSFQNSYEFKSFTSRVCAHLSKTKLNQLRSAIAKEIGHHHLSTFYRVLDSGESAHPVSGLPGVSENARISGKGEGGESSFSALGFSSQQISDIQKMINPANGGAVIVSGVVGTGKTHTARALLESIVDIRSNSVDYPPKAVAIETERLIPIAHTTYLKPDFDLTGVSLKKSMQSAARMAPDCLFVDEVRHKEAGRELVSMIQGGIQVVSTIQAGHVFSVPDRLGMMGVENPHDHKLFSGFIHQSLVRQLCTHCSTPVDIQRDGEKYKESVMRLVQATNLTRDYSGIRKRNHDGCEHCREGWSRLTVVAEVVPVTENLMRIHASEGPEKARQAFVNQGGTTIEGHAIEKVLAGEVDPVDAESAMTPMLRYRS